jgi:hypothetical protein
MLADFLGQPVHPQAFEETTDLSRVLAAEPLTAADAAFRLMQGLVNVDNLAERGFRYAILLARTLKAYSMAYSNLDQAAEWIGRLT